jgi:L-ascorbate metabolism protein UlaG (beta-lactamase superfamily)
MFLKNNKSKIVFAFILLFALSACGPLAPSAKIKKYQSYFNEVAKNEGNVTATYFGTSTILFDDGETQILVDGFFSRPATLKVAFGKVQSDEGLIKEIIEQHNINRLKGVFVCHSHYDHVMDAPLVAALTNATLYGSSSTLNVGKGENLPDSLMQEFHIGDKFQLGNFTIEILESIHTPPFEILGKSNATDPCHPHIVEPLSQPAKALHYIEGGSFDFYISHSGKNIMVKASTNYLEGALVNYPTDVFFLGTAMLGKQDEFFKNKYYLETIQMTNPSLVVPIHWDNFGKPLSKPLTALPKIGDDVSAGLNFLIDRTSKEKRKLLLMQGHQKTVLF